MSQARHHQFVHVLENRIEVFTLFRRGRRKAFENRSRLGIRIDAARFHTAQIIDDPVDRLVGILADRFRIPVQLFGGGCHVSLDFIQQRRPDWNPAVILSP